MIGSILVLLMALILGCPAGLLAQSADHIKTDNIVRVAEGRIQGVNDPETGLRYFWGIPYARPPVGPLRWREPQLVRPWEGLYLADHFGPQAMQNPIFGDMRFRTDSMSEDCLYLNVWTPARTANAGLPVLVYFYGGGFIAGDGSEWRYDGAHMAQRGVVVVTVNYRLGIFGFFAHPELTRESPHHASGNYGLLDQQAALAWVHKNIAAFGGDPGRITIGGESAGSISVFAQMASPLSKDLIAGAIGESGAMISPTLPPISLKEAESRGETFAQKVGAGSLKALRAIPARQLLKDAVGKGIPRFAVTIDGYFLPKTPLEIFEEGDQAQVPLLVGWNSTEATYMGWMRGKSPTPEHYRKIMAERFGALQKDALKLFPGNNQQQVLQSATALASAQFITFSTWKWAALHRQSGNGKVYRYLFEKPRPPVVGVRQTPPNVNGQPAPLKGAGHSWEIEYALGNLSTNPVYAWTPDDYKVSATMLAYFTRFIQKGDPNGPALPRWDANNAGEPVQVMHINVDNKLRPEKDRQQFEFLDRYFLHND